MGVHLEGVAMTCSGSGTDGTPIGIGIQYMCNMCGDLFMSHVVPEHRAGAKLVAQLERYRNLPTEHRA